MFSFFLSFFMDILDILEVLLKYKNIDTSQEFGKSPKPPKHFKDLGL